MELSNHFYRRLIQEYVDGSISHADAKRLFDFAECEPDVFEDLLHEVEIQDYAREIAVADGVNDEISMRVHEKLLRGIGDLRVQRPVQSVHFLRIAWFRYAAAVILIFGVGAYLWSENLKVKSDKLKTEQVSIVDDVAPGYNKAVLTLSDGKRIVLDSATSGTIKDGTLSIGNTNGLLKYSAMRLLSDWKSPDESIAFNTMTTPKGGQYKLVLADGTRVWLNAASSITYPIAFTGKIREVTVTGEAYFEVAAKKEKPFIVKAGTDEVTVLGTSFNVNAYPDEIGIKTSLIDGSVKVENKILGPGQAYISGQVVQTNLQHDVAWKNGFFAFDKADIKTVMRQLSRWYDIEVLYEGELPKSSITGKLGRNLTLNQVLKGLKALRINYRLENNKLIIYK